VEALLEADPKEFSFGTFYVFFLLVFFLSVEVLLETGILMNLISEIFHIILIFSSLCVKYPQEKVSPHKNTKQIFLSLSSLCGFSP